ncbi:MAG: hypothetical protein IJA34_08035 [Lachnospiraceae bacterium]|nr:hypothetical protein [Lachnospiraceae bacterium]
MKQEIIFTKNALVHYNDAFGYFCPQSRILRKKLRKLKKWQRQRDRISIKYKRLMAKVKQSKLYNR